MSAYCLSLVLILIIYNKFSFAIAQSGVKSIGQRYYYNVIIVAVGGRPAGTVKANRVEWNSRVFTARNGIANFGPCRPHTFNANRTTTETLRGVMIHILLRYIIHSGVLVYDFDTSVTRGNSVKIHSKYNIIIKRQTKRNIKMLQCAIYMYTV